MKEPKRIFCLVKFGKHEYLQKMLREGEIYFNHPKNYNELRKKEEQTGDEYEGAEWVENAYLTKINYSNPTVGQGELKLATDKLAKAIQYNYFFLSHSLYALTPDAFINGDIFNIDSRNADFIHADTAILIKEPYVFINAIIAEIKLRNLRYEANLVEYKNVSNEGRIEMTPFIKKIEHEHQSEFRIIIENIDNNPKPIHIGSIEGYSHMVSARSMIETIWTAKRK